jgi:hypothetical protein
MELPDQARKLTILFFNHSLSTNHFVMKLLYTLFYSILLVGISLCAFAQQDKVIAQTLIEKHLNELSLNSLNDVIVSDAYPNAGSGTFLVYMQQAYQDIRVSNAIKTLVFKDEKLISQEGEFVGKIQVKAKNNVSSLTPVEAINRALEHLNIEKPSSFVTEPLKIVTEGKELLFNSSGVSEENILVTLMWVPELDGTVSLAWQVGINPIKDSDNWLVRVNAVTGSIIDKLNLTIYCSWGAAPEAHAPSVVHNPDGTHTSADLSDQGAASPLAVNSAVYRVVPYPAESPQHPGGSFANRTSPWTLAGASSPATTLNWHNDGTTEYNISRGNNVYAQEDRDNSNTTFGLPATSSTALPSLTFTSVFDPANDPTLATNQAAAITNLFYWNNIIHDITYQYGFNEVSGNFQNNNQGRGGAQGDYVIADAQDAGGVNNANFSTPTDGSRPRMQMFLWDTKTPNLDGDLDNGIIIHEYAHGISIRLTGGPSQVGCLQNAEQMGEGWSDYYGLMLTTNWSTAQVTDGSIGRGIGTYALNQPTTGNGIRTYPYTTNMAVNPFTYADIGTGSGRLTPHRSGSIWATMIWDMTWEIIQDVGIISANLYDTTGIGGNIVAMRLVTEGLKLQPCSPGFVDGRNAILKADTLLYGGRHSCAIWRAFARRGVGVDALQGTTSSITDQTVSFDAPISRITKTANTADVTTGQQITYTLKVDCECQPFSNYNVVDTLAVGSTYVSGGTYNAASRVVSFGPISLSVGQSTTFTLRVTNTLSPISVLGSSITHFTSDGNTLGTWTSSSLVNTRTWTTSTTKSNSPSSSWFMQSLGSNAATALTSPSYSLPNAETEFSFWHDYNLENTYDGAVIEISTDGGTNWIDLGGKIAQNGYNRLISNDWGSYIGGRQAFSGNSVNFIKTVVDLNSYKNQAIKLRFLMADDNSVSSAGWYVDDILLKSETSLSNTAYLRNSGNVVVSKSSTKTPIIPTVTIQSIASGAWNITSTWSCGCIPQPSSIVSVNTSHIITINGITANARTVIGNGGSVQITNNGTLQLNN